MCKKLFRYLIQKWRRILTFFRFKSRVFFSFFLKKKRTNKHMKEMSFPKTPYKNKLLSLQSVPPNWIVTPSFGSISPFFRAQHGTNKRPNEVNEVCATISSKTTCTCWTYGPVMNSITGFVIAKIQFVPEKETQEKLDSCRSVLFI